MNEIEKIISKFSYNFYPYNDSNKNINNNNINYFFDKSRNRLKIKGIYF